MGDRESRVGVTCVQTKYGWVGLAWAASGLVASTLPQPSESEALRRLPASAGSALDEPPGLDVTALEEKLCRYFEGEAVVFDELLDPAIGTEFQRRVWALTRAIPRGQTRTYGEIARKVGSPRAARAVGQAMARNPRPVVVPCHRVVGHDGRLTGFGGGVDMKLRMLRMEGAIEPGATQPSLFDEPSIGDRESTQNLTPTA